MVVNILQKEVISKGAREKLLKAKQEKEHRNFFKIFLPYQSNR